MGTAATIQTPTKLMNKENAEMILEKIVDHIVMYISDESSDSEIILNILIFVTDTETIDLSL